MKRFRFRLEQVLRVRRLQEDMARAELMHAHREARAAADRVNARIADYSNAPRPSGEQPFDEFHRVQFHLDNAAGAITVARAGYQHALGVVDDRRCRLGRGPPARRRARTPRNPPPRRARHRGAPRRRPPRRRPRRRPPLPRSTAHDHHARRVDRPGVDWHPSRTPTRPRRASTCCSPAPAPRSSRDRDNHEARRSTSRTATKSPDRRDEHDRHDHSRCDRRPRRLRRGRRSSDWRPVVRAPAHRDTRPLRRARRRPTPTRPPPVAAPPRRH